MADEKRKTVIYANYAEIGMSAFDISIDLGRRVGDEMEIQTTIVMSPQHFKAFANIIFQNLHQYEEMFGDINFEPNQEVIKRLEDEGKLKVESIGDIN